MSKIRVCFLGTPDFAATHLQALIEDEHYEVVGVVTQPDRPAGRKLQLTPSPVKVLAHKYNLNVLTPENLKNDSQAMQEIKNWKAEVAIVVAYGQILSQEFLDSFTFGAVNVHGSLLPKWRGAAPIQRSIEAGDQETGVALQRVVKKLDAGDVIGVRRVAIDSTMNAKDLYERLAILGADLLKVELMDYLRGHLAPTPQDESQVTYAKKIEKEEAKIDWGKSAEQIHNKVRAFVMGPGTFCLFNSLKIKVHKTLVEKNNSTAASGEIIEATDVGIKVKCGKDALVIKELQPESRARMTVQEFLKGHPLSKGNRFE